MFAPTIVKKEKTIITVLYVSAFRFRDFILKIIGGIIKNKDGKTILIWLANQFFWSKY